MDGTLSDGERRWPVVAGIPWLRAGREEVRIRAVAALDVGDPEGAAIVLLADHDDRSDEAASGSGRMHAALRADTLSQAVEALGLGRVGVDVRHRWCDPSWLAALALTAAHPPAGRQVVDLACGAGHLLRHLHLHGHRDLIGVDAVFAKLWLARRFVLPPGAPVDLVCADLTGPLPLPPPHRPRYVAAHKALHLLDDKAGFVESVRRHTGHGGALVFGHCHNVLHRAGATGLPLDPASWVGLLPGAACYAEEELTAAAVGARAPRAWGPIDLAGTEAVGMALDATAAAPDLALLGPAPGAALRPNPFYGNGSRPRVRHWPHPRWEAEYGPAAAAYLPPRWEPLTVFDAIRRRLLLDLPERW